MVVLDGELADPRGGSGPAPLEASIAARFPRHAATVLCTRAHGSEVTLVPAREAAAVPAGPATSLPYPLTRGGIPGRDSALQAALAEGVRRGAAAIVLASGAPRAHEGWLAALVAPVLEGTADYVRPTYARGPTDGILNTGLVYPLTRALYGKRLRQPLGGEACVSLALARRLLADPDWRRDPDHAGSDAWLVAKVLAGKDRACQAWIGAMPVEGGGEPEDAAQAVARVVGPVFREMGRHSVRWQRVDGSQAIPATGDERAAPPSGPGPRHSSAERLVEAFRLAQSELKPVWSLVLPPGTLLALRAAARAPTEHFRLPDPLWARVVYDFAVAYHVKAMDRGQVLAAFTPVYLGWAGSYLHEVHGVDPAVAEDRVEALCGAFEKEKPYLIGRWRWPDGFMP